jgi:hypothetical protein
VNYHDKLLKTTQFVEENFDDPAELIIALGLSVEDIINYLPDVLVANYKKFFEADENIDEDDQDHEANLGVGEDWEEPEA